MAGEIRERQGMLAASTNGQPTGDDVIDLNDDSLHIEGPEPRELDDSGVDPVHQDRWGTLENLIDGFVEAFNAHDLDGMMALFSHDVELPGLGGDAFGFPDTIGSVWNRRPNAILTRGLLEDEPVTVVWDVDDHGVWQRVALFCYDATDDRIGLVELIDDAGAAHDAETAEPEHEVVEGATWDEWYEGVDFADA